MTAKKRNCAATTDDLDSVRTHYYKSEEASMWQSSKTRQEAYFARQKRNEPRKAEVVYSRHAEFQKRVPKINEQFQKSIIQGSKRIHNCIRRRILNWRQEMTPGQFLQIEKNSHHAHTLHHSSYAVPCGKISRRTGLLWQAIGSYDSLFRKHARPTLNFEPLTFVYKPKIQVSLTGCPHPDFQDGIKLNANSPWQDRITKLQAASFVCLIGDVSVSGSARRNTPLWGDPTLLMELSAGTRVNVFHLFILVSIIGFSLLRLREFIQSSLAFFSSRERIERCFQSVLQ
jgi:hypothetical protein